MVASRGNRASRSAPFQVALWPFSQPMMVSQQQRSMVAVV
jgi:hypothetical protein